jgi:hypothetical protein
VEQKLRLNEFKTLRKAWSRGIPWWDHLVFAFLWWLEEKIINYRIKTEVDKAVESVEMPVQDYITPVYTETPGEGLLGFPEMRLSAPWYEGGEDGVKPAVTDSERSEDF